MKDAEERWSVPSICILIVVILIGTLARLCYPSLISLTSDEIASLYFALNPAQIFLTETHPPLFYLLLSPFAHFFDPFALRTLVSLMSLGLLGWSAYLSREVLTRTGTTILVILIFLSPPDIFHARTIRQYSLFLELTLIFYILVQTNRPAWIKMLIAFLLSGIHPLGWIPPATHALWTMSREKKLSRSVLRDILVLVPIVCWYGAKFLLVGKTSFFTHYQPTGNKYAPFYVDLINSFSGEHYPRINYLPLPEFSLILTGSFFSILVICGLVLLWKKKSPPFISLGLGMIYLTFVFSEIFSSSVVDIWNGRFFIFLLGPIYFIAAQMFSQVRWVPVFLSVIYISNLVLIGPFRPYIGDRELFDYYQSSKKLSPELHLVFCGNIFQRWHYLKDVNRNCIADIKSVQESKKEFILVDLNGQGLNEIMKFRNQMSIGENRRFNFTGLMRGKFINPQTGNE